MTANGANSNGLHADAAATVPVGSGQNSSIGRPIPRVDGRLKVTGAAKYAADWTEKGLAHAVIFGSTIASGKIKSFDLSRARAVPGVIEIVTFQNAPRLKLPESKPGSGSGETFVPLQDGKIYYNGQHIGAVVAETLEAAQEAALLVRVSYGEKTPDLDLVKLQEKSYVIDEMPGMGEINSSTGNLNKGFARATHIVDHVYTTPIENHNPIEPSAILAIFKGDSVTAYDSTQRVYSSAEQISELFGLPLERTHVVTHFIGGGFGCKGSCWPHQMIGLMAAKMTGRPVKLSLPRPQMLTGVGHRSFTIQRVKLGADHEGNLQGILHETVNNTAVNKDFSERCGTSSSMLYKCDNVKIEHRLVRLNLQTPTFMRAPGHNSGSFAMECAMDELAVALGLDPIDLRLRNYAEADQHEKKPYTSKTLSACYRQGAEKFGWSKRPTKPGSRREDGWLVGYGMATATYPAKRFPATARVQLRADGTATVSSATQDIGTGTYTTLTQIAADELGLPFKNVKIDIGDSRLPPASVSGGSTTMASVGSAIHLACQDLKRRLAELVTADAASPLRGTRAEDLSLADGRLVAKAGASEPISAIMGRHALEVAKGEAKAEDAPPEKMKFSGHSFGAQFAEVGVHALTGEVRVARLLGAFAAGKIINPLTAKSQLHGGMIFGLGQALMEASLHDARTGRHLSKDLADYHLPVNADVPPIEILMVSEADAAINEIGVKGIGEIGIVGLAAAIANGVYNATGLRVRDLPITPDRLLSATANRRA